MTRAVHGFFRDEQGDKSLARVLATLMLGFTVGLVLVSWILDKPLGDGVVHLLEVTNAGLISWAGLPRVARYFKRQARVDGDIPEAS